MLSIRAKREHGTGIYQADKRSDVGVLAHFGVIIKQKDLGVSIEHGIPDEPGDRGNAVLAAEVMKKLTDCYPGYSWVVEIDDRPTVGMVHIYNQDVNAALFSNKPYGYRLHLKKVQNDPNLACVMRAGGEILERAALARGWNKGDVPSYVEGVHLQHQPLRTHRLRAGVQSLKRLIS